VHRDDVEGQVSKRVEGPDGTDGSAVPRDLAENRPGELVRAQAQEIDARSPLLARVLARAFFIHTDERASRRGAEGEEAVGSRLRKLDDEWRVLHSVPVGNGDCDIDHVVIGPCGVFTLNTKNHAGKKVWIHTNSFKVSGYSQPYLPKARGEGERASRLLSRACAATVPVQPVIVVIADEITMKGVPDGVLIASPRKLVRKLTSEPSRLDAVQVDAIYEQARRSTTWR